MKILVAIATVLFLGCAQFKNSMQTQNQRKISSETTSSENVEAQQGYCSDVGSFIFGETSKEPHCTFRKNFDDTYPTYISLEKFKSDKCTSIGSPLIGYSDSGNMHIVLRNWGGSIGIEVPEIGVKVTVFKDSIGALDLKETDHHRSIYIFCRNKGQ